MFASLAVTSQVRTSAQVGVLAAERGQFGHAQPGLDGHVEQGVVAAPVQVPVRRGQQGAGLLGGQEADTGRSYRFGGMASTR